jgi:hypothetical protein
MVAMAHAFGLDGMNAARTIRSGSIEELLFRRVLDRVGVLETRKLDYLAKRIAFFMGGGSDA